MNTIIIVMFGFLKRKNKSDENSPDQRIRQVLSNVTRRKWEIASFSPESVTIELTDLLKTMEPEEYKNYLEELKNISDDFFIENDSLLRCRVQTRHAERFIAIIEDNSFEFLKIINDGVNVD